MRFKKLDTKTWVSIVALAALCVCALHALDQHIMMDTAEEAACDPSYRSPDTLKLIGQPDWHPNMAEQDPISEGQGLLDPQSRQQTVDACRGVLFKAEKNVDNAGANRATVTFSFGFANVFSRITVVRSGLGWRRTPGILHSPPGASNSWIVINGLTLPNTGRVTHTQFGPCWPFTVESAVIGHDDDGGVTAAIQGKTYALNMVAAEEPRNDREEGSPNRYADLIKAGFWKEDPTGANLHMELGPIVEYGLALPVTR